MSLWLPKNTAEQHAMFHCDSNTIFLLIGCFVVECLAYETISRLIPDTQELRNRDNFAKLSFGRNILNCCSRILLAAGSTLLMQGIAMWRDCYAQLLMRTPTPKCLVFSQRSDWLLSETFSWRYRQAHGSQKANTVWEDSWLNQCRLPHHSFGMS